MSYELFCRAVLAPAVGTHTGRPAVGANSVHPLAVCLMRDYTLMIYGFQELFSTIVYFLLRLALITSIIYMK